MQLFRRKEEKCFTSLKYRMFKKRKNAKIRLNSLKNTRKNLNFRTNCSKMKKNMREEEKYFRKCKNTNLNHWEIRESTVISKTKT